MPYDKKLKITVANLRLYDRIHEIAKEYSVSPELLINLAIKKLLDDIDFWRNMRMGKGLLD
ncbi:MAG: hypothetical protein FWH01_17160 [Oscillospiraceae bacterium]|nr:hypothetical protein [Oscillospiraceae bacterium]